jgi:hypothetical protein
MITDVAITGLTKAMDSLKGSIESAFAFAQRAEKSSMALLPLLREQRSPQWH